MKIILTIVAMLAISGCELSFEQVKARAQYCRDNQLTPMVVTRGNTPYRVLCQDSDGTLYEPPAK